MKICLIILALIGLLKVVSLFILFGVELYCRKRKIDINGVRRDSGVYFDSQWYIIPTISFSKTNKYLEIMIYWLSMQLYYSYSIDKDEDEK